MWHTPLCFPFFYMLAICHSLTAYLEKLTFYKRYDIRDTEFCNWVLVVPRTTRLFDVSYFFVCLFQRQQEEVLIKGPGQWPFVMPRPPITQKTEKGKCLSEGGKHNTEGMLCLSAMPLEQRSLVLKIPASHRTARERAFELDDPMATGQLLQSRSYFLQVFIISSQLVINQSVCVVSKKPAEEIGNARQLFKTQNVPGKPRNFSFSTGPNIYQSLSLTPRHAGAIRGNQTQTVFHVQVGPPRLISFTVKKKKKGLKTMIEIHSAWMLFFEF